MINLEGMAYQGNILIYDFKFDLFPIDEIIIIEISMFDIQVQNFSTLMVRIHMYW
jgi:hypothetical protein